MGGNEVGMVQQAFAPVDVQRACVFNVIRMSHFHRLQRAVMDRDLGAAVRSSVRATSPRMPAI